MITVIPLSSNVVLRHCYDDRFKTAYLSVQLLRPMCAEEASLNALLGPVLSRGTVKHPDMRSLTVELDGLYGATVSPLMRRIGDVQAIGLFAGCLEDRFALPGDAVLAPVLDLVREMLLEPKTVEGHFDAEYVESEKKNLIADIESELNDKRSYAAIQMLRHLCQGDSFALSLRGTVEEVRAITAERLYAHYHKVLSDSPVEIFYVGSAQPETVAELLRPMAGQLARNAVPMAPQTPLTVRAEEREFSETMDINQGKLSMGFTTPVTNGHPDFVAMQVFNSLYGAGMTSKLFVNVREKLSLCYYASSGFYGSKGIVTVSSGIDESNYETARAEILRQLQLTAAGEITESELSAAKKGLISGLTSIPDSPGALENFYGTCSIAGLNLDLEAYIARIRTVSAEDVARCARSLKLHTVFFLKGVAK